MTEALAIPARRRRRHLPGPLLVGGGIVAVLIVVVATAPLIAPYPYDQFHIHDRLSPPSLRYLFGTDEYGRDVLSRVLVGAQLSVTLGLVATAVNMVLGVPLGLLAGYKRGLVDELVMRAMDVMMSFPPILLVLLILVVASPSLLKTATAIGILFVPTLARVVRGATLELMSAEFIEAARARGERGWYILLRELLPNVWPILVVEASLRMVFAVLMGAVLSFLNFGVQPPAADWGLMISSGRAFVDAAPWISLAPGLALGVTVIGVSLFGDGLRELLDPRLRGQR